jgi:hypothetical protein
MQHRLATPVGRIPGSDRLHTRPWNKPEQNVSNRVFLLIGARRQYGVAGTWDYHCPLSRHTSFPWLDVADLLEFGHACEGGRMRKVR